MATTTDPQGRKPGTDLHGRGDLDAKTDTGAGHGHAVEHGVATGDFDREISLSRILWSGAWLVIVTLVAALLMWWFLRGFQTYDQHHEVAMTPMQKIHQPPPPAPLLQIDPTRDMVDMRNKEDQSLLRAGWVDQPGGTLRVPVDVAMNAIVRRGVAPFPATGAPAGTAGAAAGTAAAGQTPLQTRTRQEQKNPADNRKPGATVQNAQAPPAPPAPPAAPVPPPVR
jgi:hypothetical protein